MMIPPEGLSDEACEEIAGHILVGMKNVHVGFSKTGNTVPVVLSRSILSSFLTRLNLNRRVMLPAAAKAASDSEREFFSRARMIMRNERYTASPAREEFIAEMIGRLMSDDRVSEQTILDCLEFVLKLFDESAEDADVYSMISEEKRSLESLLEGMSRYREYAERYSMEYLMSKRIQRPAVDQEEAMKRIYLSDVICMSVYGKPADSSRQS